MTPHRSPQRRSVAALLPSSHSRALPQICFLSALFSPRFYPFTTPAKISGSPTSYPSLPKAASALRSFSVSPTFCPPSSLSLPAVLPTRAARGARNLLSLSSCLSRHNPAACPLKVHTPASSSALAATSNNASRCRANSVCTRQPRPDYGHGFQVKVLKIFQVVPSSLASG